MRLTDASRTREPEHCTCFVPALCCDPTPELRGNLIDDVILADDLRFQLGCELFGIDCRELCVLGLIAPLKLSFVSKPVENVHDDPRKVAPFIQQKRGTGHKGQGDQKLGKRRRRLHHDNHNKKDAESAGPRSSYHGVGTWTVCPSRRLSGTRASPICTPTVIQPPLSPSTFPVNVIGTPGL